MASLEIIKLEWATPIFKVVEHSQDGLYILLQGQISWRNSSQTYDLDEGNMLFLRRGSYAVRCGTKEPCQLLWIPLPGSFLSTFLHRFGSLLSEIRRDNATPKPLLIFNISPILSQSIQNLCAILERSDFPSVLTQLRIEELLLLLAFSSQGTLFLSALRHLGNRPEERLQKFMEENYLQGWKLSKFAREFGMGLTTFKELFGTVYGISPRAWISERRILYAHQLLLNGKMSIVDIAMEAGFSSQSYFTQSYRRRFGCTPSQARLTKIATTG
ncbi:TPA: virulence regulon transcriptional activator VirF [Yersinia enterocolitica]